MKKFLLAGAALVAMAGAAAAADLPRKSAAPAPYVPAHPAFTWTGFYVGLNAGYGFSHTDNADYAGNAGYAALAPAVPLQYKLGRDGFVGGGQVGYNQQFGAFVAGLETDIQYTDFRKRASDALGTARAEQNYLGTVRGRLGYAGFDRTLLYVTGGLAYGDTKLSTTVNALPAFASKNDTNVGYALGAGVEYAFTNNITGKLEYLYTNLGDTKVTVADGAGNAAVLKAKNEASIVRVGVNYKF